MRLFQQGKVQILVSTTVIEVGVDVPNATVMVIEHAERFGLAQLHQLRGRIGRGRAKSYCILMTSGKVSEEAGRRLEAIVRTTDGFQIAELDLEMRGPGEFFGTRQAGLPSFRVANLIRDRELLELAKHAATTVLSGPNAEISQDEIDRADETAVELIAKRAHGVRFDVEYVASKRECPVAIDFRYHARSIAKAPVRRAGPAVPSRCLDRPAGNPFSSCVAALSPLYSGPIHHVARRSRARFR